MEIPQTLKLEIYLGQIFPKEFRMSHHRDPRTHIFIAAQFGIAKASYSPWTDEWIKKMHLHTVEYHSAIKGDKLEPSAGNGCTWRP